MQVEQFFNIIRAVKDQEASIHFYRDILGLKLERTSDLKDNPTATEFHSKLYNLAHTRYLGANFSDGKSSLHMELTQHIEPLAGSMPEDYRVFDAGFTRFTLQVTDIKVAYEELKAKGVKFRGAPAIRPEGGGNLLIYDPDGQIVGLSQPWGSQPSGKMEVVQFVNIIRAVKDLDTSVHFYCDLLGLKLERIIDTKDNPAQAEFHRQLYNVSHEVRFRDAFISDGKTPLALELVQYIEPPANPMPEDYRIFDAGFTRFTLYVPDAKAAYEELKAKGVKFRAPVVSRVGGGGNVHVLDPDGQTVGLNQSRQT
jgi:catechol 2,3-dioxygenase-like lactoylglutathione lyase family enzyme